ncbi:DUF1249 domain-containing protein [Halochromatium roseum]|uniref:DUF1249 domain-containing protein n=1 Tax=Halochromatium roseum TaxID=391920 RepID=UPI001F5CCB67|nr:DUF1249 domain-containing protein [Halochromatium roseum]
MPATNVGGLMSLCEENYAALMRLAPNLPQLTGQLRSQPERIAELTLSIVDQSPYTTTLRLTHLLQVEATAQHQQPSEPDALLRAYHDAEQVEVLNLRQTVLPILSHYQAPALASKWRANLFVSKWLSYCLHQGYRFSAKADQTAAADFHELLPSA